MLVSGRVSYMGSYYGSVFSMASFIVTSSEPVGHSGSWNHLSKCPISLGKSLVHRLLDPNSLVLQLEKVARAALSKRASCAQKKKGNSTRNWAPSGLLTQGWSTGDSTRYAERWTLPLCTKSSAPSQVLFHKGLQGLQGFLRHVQQKIEKHWQISFFWLM